MVYLTLRTWQIKQEIKSQYIKDYFCLILTCLGYFFRKVSGDPRTAFHLWESDSKKADCCSVCMSGTDCLKKHKPGCQWSWRPMEKKSRDLTFNHVDFHLTPSVTVRQPIIWGCCPLVPSPFGSNSPEDKTPGSFHSKEWRILSWLWKVVIWSPGLYQFVLTFNQSFNFSNSLIPCTHRPQEVCYTLDFRAFSQYHSINGFVYWHFQFSTSSCCYPVEISHQLSFFL